MSRESGSGGGAPVFLEVEGADRGDVRRRERAATALEAALGFIERHGDPPLLRRAHVALKALPAAREIEAIAAAQEPDGSFPPREWGARPGLLEALGRVDLAEQPASLVGTLDALSALADLRALHAECAARAEAYLRQTQSGDGSWGVPGRPAVDGSSGVPGRRAVDGSSGVPGRRAVDGSSGVPGRHGVDGPRAGEGDPTTRIYLTGMLGGFLGRTRFVRPEVLHAAGEFLAGLWSPERVEGGSAAALAAYAHFFTNVHHDLADEALQWCGRELERGFRTRRSEALLVGRVLLWCDAAALPGFGVAPREVLDRLLDEQAGDGGFAELAVDGPSARLVPTLDALRVIQALCAAF